MSPKKCCLLLLVTVNKFKKWKYTIVYKEQWVSLVSQ